MERKSTKASTWSGSCVFHSDSSTRLSGPRAEAAANCSATSRPLSAPAPFRERRREQRPLSASEKSNRLVRQAASSPPVSAQSCS